MKKIHLIIGGIASLALILLIAYFVSKKPVADGAGSFPIAKHIRMRYKLTNTSDEILKNVSLKLFAPVPVMPNQRLASLTSNNTYQESSDDAGNKLLTFTLDQVNPYQTQFIDLRVNLEMAVKPQGHSKAKHAMYLSDSPGIEVSNEKMQKLATRLKRDTEVDTLKAHYQWIVDNMVYAGYVKDDMGALYALENKKGDCTEYAYLMAALARAEGMPARVIGGYVYPEDAVVRAEDYHNWTEVFINGQWHIIDTQKQRFMEKYDEYIAFRIIQDDSSELKTSHQIVISSENIEVSL